MKASYIVAGLGAGVILGSSSGVAFGGNAYNGAVVFGPLGALVGWLFSKGDASSASGRDADPLTASPGEDVQGSPTVPPDDQRVTFGSVVHAIIAILAGIWNFHIECLDAIRLLGLFKARPWLFVVVAIVVSLLFPPFSILYLVCYVSATHFGFSDQGDFRANIK